MKKKKKSNGPKTAKLSRADRYAEDAKPWPLARICRVLGRGRRELETLLANVEPAEKLKLEKRYFVADVVKLLVDGHRNEAKEKTLNADARYKESRARLQETRLAMQSRQLVGAGEVEAAVSGLLAGVKRKMLAIPTRIAPRVARAKKAADALALLKGEIDQALFDLSGADPRDIIAKVETPENADQVEE